MKKQILTPFQLHPMLLSIIMSIYNKKIIKINYIEYKESVKKLISSKIFHRILNKIKFKTN